jgi:hypothetical protein
MPGVRHEGPIELLRRNPLLAGALLQGSAVPVPDGAAATVAAADLSSARPAELRADALVLLEGPSGKLAVLVESQTSPDSDKRWVWPAYLALARAEHRCPAVLIVVCPGRVVGAWT